MKVKNLFSSWLKDNIIIPISIIFSNALITHPLIPPLFEREGAGGEFVNI